MAGFVHIWPKIGLKQPNFLECMLKYSQITVVFVVLHLMCF